MENGQRTGFLPSASRSSGGAPAAVRGKPFATQTLGKKNVLAHNMTVLRISSYHAGKIPDFSEKQPHNMSFYRDIVIICRENERAGHAGSEIREMTGLSFCSREVGVMSKFSPAQPGLARKTSHRNRLFPGRAENNL